MPEPTLLEYNRPPAVAPSYLRAATTLSGGLAEGASIPAIKARISNQRAPAKALKKYRKVCGFAANDSLPVTYPHVMAFPVHMAVMTQSDFPLKLLGLVHVRNKITQHRDIASDEPLDLQVQVGGHRDVHNGIEFDLITEYQDTAGQLVWSGSSTMLSRGHGKGQRSGSKSGRKPDGQTDKNKQENDASLEFGRYATWDAPEDIGRRYAGCAGDYNPIHLTALSAKLFGFPRAIAHGMWLKARIAAEIANSLKQPGYSIEVGFKKPVLLPSSVMLKYNPGSQGVDFNLSNPDGDIRHMWGKISYL